MRAASGRRYPRCVLVLARFESSPALAAAESGPQSTAGWLRGIFRKLPRSFRVGTAGSSESRTPLGSAVELRPEANRSRSTRQGWRSSRTMWSEGASSSLGRATWSLALRRRAVHVWKASSSCSRS